MEKSSVSFKQDQESGDSTGETGRRPQIHGETLAEARMKAEEILFGMVQEIDDHPGLEISEAFAKTIKSKICQNTTRKHYIQFAGYFCDWADKNNITYWHQLRFYHLHDYLRYLIKKTSNERQFLIILSL